MTILPFCIKTSGFLAMIALNLHNPMSSSAQTAEAYPLKLQPEATAVALFKSMDRNHGAALYLHSQVDDAQQVYSINKQIFVFAFQEVGHLPDWEWKDYLQNPVSESGMNHFVPAGPVIQDGDVVSCSYTCRIGQETYALKQFIFSGGKGTRVIRAFWKHGIPEPQALESLHRHMALWSDSLFAEKR